MRLFLYYALHSLKNQIKKLMKTWVLIFLLVCMLAGGAVGLIAGSLSERFEDVPPEDGIVDTLPDADLFEEDAADVPTDEPDGQTDTEPLALFELAAGGIVLAVFLFMIYGADKNGSAIFQPADANLLFASPLTPQAVLLFRLSTRLGVVSVFGLYLLFELPMLSETLGLGFWGAISVLAAGCLTVVLATLLQALLFALSSTHPTVKRLLSVGVYAILAVLALSWLVVYKQSGAGPLDAALLLFNTRSSRYIPIWGWLKGLCLYAAENNLPAALLCLFGLLLAAALLMTAVSRVRTDFYEEALAHSEEMAELLEKAQSENANGMAVKRKKDRSEKLRRDRFTHGAGANVFFYKAMYNRFRFAHFGFLTKTTEFYLVVALLVGAICRFAAQTDSFLPMALTLSALVFYRSLGDPLEQDIKNDLFRLLPESASKKLFFSVLGGSVNCLLDLLLPLLVGAVFVGASPLSALAWLPFIVSVDFYATSMGALIGLSVPVNAGRVVKQIVQILFLYFGLLPDAALITTGVLSERATLFLILAALVNVFLGVLSLGLSQLFLEPKNRPLPLEGKTDVDLRVARRRFSRLGFSGFWFLVASAVVEAIAVGVSFLFPEQSDETSALTDWIVTFLPMYAVGVPVCLLCMRRVPASPPVGRKMTLGQIACVIPISIFLMQAGNLLGTAVVTLLHELFRLDAVNPILPYAMDTSLGAKTLVLAILAPIIEEYIFRKQMIDRMRRYGERTAVVVSALVFGLFHGNLSQFFYAFALGLIFGYIYLKTGRLRYSIGLHVGINFLGGVVSPWLLSDLDLETLTSTTSDLDLLAQMSTGSPKMIGFAIYLAVMLLLALTGFVLLCVKGRSVRFEQAENELPARMRFRTVWLNPGMILLTLVCLLSFVLTTISVI